MKLFERLKASSHDEWVSYVDHRFVRELGAGTLPERAFQTYLIQDYLFLIQFARAWALAAYKCRRIDDIRRCHETLSSILSETELHVSLCERWGLSRTMLEMEAEKPQTVAYTRFVLDCGAAGDLLDLMVALAPCVIGYAEIGQRLALDGPEGCAAHPYGEWIAAYADDSYQRVAAAARQHLDDLAQVYFTEARFAEISTIFAKATRLEADFWEMSFG